MGMDVVLGFITDIGLSAVKDKIKGAAMEAVARKRLMEFLERQHKLNFNCTMEEEIDFGGLSIYICNDLIEDIKLRFFGNREERDDAHKTIVAKLFSVLAIEEPEAHLHPSLQYRFLKFLNDNMKSNVRQIFISTHSPNITAASKLDNLIVLNKEKEDIEISYPGRIFDKNNKNDKVSKAYIERYLDVTKSDMLFAKRIILVEGISEQLLLPVFTQYLKSNLVDSHVAVINIGGRYFSHFLRLFDRDKSAYAINKRVAVITDLDPVRKKAGVKGAKFCSCYPFELRKDSSYEYKATSNTISEFYSDRKKAINVFTQRENIGCTFEYELLLHKDKVNKLNLASVLGGHTVDTGIGCYAYRATHWLDASLTRERFFEILHRSLSEAQRGYSTIENHGSL